jgi:hypothetical protein
MSLQVWNSDISDRVFDMLNKGEWRIKRLIIQACKIDDSFAKKISISAMSHLHVLVLESVPVGNKGLS